MLRVHISTLLVVMFGTELRDARMCEGLNGLTIAMLTAAPAANAGENFARPLDVEGDVLRIGPVDEGVVQFPQAVTGRSRGTDRFELPAGTLERIKSLHGGLFALTPKGLLKKSGAVWNRAISNPGALLSGRRLIADEWQDRLAHVAGIVPECGKEAVL